ncbi:hypothetical protein [Pricia sp.]|uniref:hypothetical protein n=1 Tax=Pricia sp. TaxID=2268138 RepID=UPI0035938D92
MSKSRMLFILLGLWLFAIAAPSVITLIDVDTPVVVSNLNEEEHQEQGKKSVDEKKVDHNGLSDFSLLSQWQESILYSPYLLRNSEHRAEIVLPPPECIV